jgi:hypothetical protein
MSAFENYVGESSIRTSLTKYTSRHMLCFLMSKFARYFKKNAEGAFKNGQSRESGNIGHTRRRKAKQKHNTICVAKRKQAQIT